MFVSKVTLSLGSQIFTLRFLGFFQNKQRYTRHAIIHHPPWLPSDEMVRPSPPKRSRGLSFWNRSKLRNGVSRGFSQSLWNRHCIFWVNTARKPALPSFKNFRIVSHFFSHYFSPPGWKKLQNTWIPLQGSFHATHMCHMDKAIIHNNFTFDMSSIIVSGSPSKIPTYQGPGWSRPPCKLIGNQHL